MTAIVDAIDISSTSFWNQPFRVRDEAFATLRTRPAVTFHPAIELGTVPGGPGFWAVTKHEDIVSVSRNAELFCSSQGVGFSDIPAELNEPFGSFLMTDAPRHTYLRRLVSRAFTPKQVGTIEAQILEQARTIVREAVDKGTCDVVDELSIPLPLWTISEMLGVPDDRRGELHEAANQMVAASDPKALAGYADPFTVILTAAITLSTLGSDLAASGATTPEPTCSPRWSRPPSRESDSTIKRSARLSCCSELRETTPHGTRSHTGYRVRRESGSMEVASPGFRALVGRRRRRDPSLGDTGADVPTNSDVRHIVWRATDRRG